MTNQNYNHDALSENDLATVTGGDGVLPCFVYILKRGDCVSVLAQRYGTTVKDLCELNNISNPNLIYEGNKILIPYKQ